MKVASPSFSAPYSLAAAEENLLVNAVNDGDFQELQRLLKSGSVKIDAMDESGSTAFMRAAYLNRVDMMELLSPGNALKLNERNVAGETALMQAARSNSLDAMLWLIKAGADVNIMDNSGSTAFLEYIHSLAPGVEPNEEVVSVFLKADLYVDAVDADGRNALMLLVNMPGSGKYMLSNEVYGRGDINAIDKNGCTALYLAAESGDYVFGKFLVGLGALVETVAHDDRTAQDVAEDNGQFLLSEYLSEVRGASLRHSPLAVKRQRTNDEPAVVDNYGLFVSPEANDINGDFDRWFALRELNQGLTSELAADKPDYSKFKLTPLMDAVISGNVDEIRNLLESEGVDVNARGPSGWTALMYAAVSDEEDFLEFFLDELDDNGIAVDLNLRNDKNQSALILSALKGEEGDMKLFLERGAEEKLDVNVVENISGRNAFMIYVGGCQSDIDDELVRLFLGHNLKLECRDENSQTAAMLFSGKMGRVAKEVFLRAELTALSIDLHDSDGMNALMHAVDDRDFEYFELLVDKGADFNLIIGGRSARSIALEKGFDEFVEAVDRMNAMLSKPLDESMGRSATDKILWPMVDAIDAVDDEDILESLMRLNSID